MIDISSVGETVVLDFAKYLQCLEQSGLIEPAGIDYHLEQYENLSKGAADDPVAFGQLLVSAGALTTWQNDHLHRGRFKGFHLGGYTITEPWGLLGPGAYFVRQGHATHPIVLRAVPMERRHGSDAFLDMLPRLKAIDSPYVVRVLDGGVEGQTTYLIEERIDGRLLQTAVDDDGPLSLRAALRAILDAAQGLDALHAVGVTYLMFTPEDLLLHAGGAKVIQIESPITGRSGPREVMTIDGDRDGWQMQEASYWGPDQTRDVRTDVYCLGCVLYFALLGQPPLQGAQHVESPPPNLRLARPDVPQVLADLFQQMLAKDPNERPQSMAAVCHALRQME